MPERFLTKAEWDVDALNARRLKWLQDDPTTRYDERGVIALDDVLIDWVCDRDIPGAFTFDSYFSSAASLNHMHGKQNQRGKSIRADQFIATIAREDRKELRCGQGQTRHMYLVMLAYSLLMRELKRTRAVSAETLRTTITWAMRQIDEDSQNSNTSWPNWR